MSFTGTLDKCKVCDKTVHFMDVLYFEGVPYHKSCFRCCHCKGNLVMNTYSSMDGVLYCKPHFEQLFKESGNFSKNFQTSKEKHDPQSRPPSKLSSLFIGTQDKCSACNKTVYPFEKVNMEGDSYHKSCFRCAHGGCPLTHSSYAALNGVLYCKYHFNRLFLEKGNFSHVLEATTHKRNNSVSEADENQAEDEKQVEDENQAEEEGAANGNEEEQNEEES